MREKVDGGRSQTLSRQHKTIRVGAEKTEACLSGEILAASYLCKKPLPLSPRLNKPFCENFNTKNSIVIIKRNMIYMYGFAPMCPSPLYWRAGDER